MARLGGVQQRQALGEISYVPKITVDRDHFERKEESERERERLRQREKDQRIGEVDGSDEIDL